MRILNQKYWPHRIQLAEPSYSTNPNWGNERIQWCKDQLGWEANHWNWTSGIVNGERKTIFYFTQEFDLTLFMLRWPS